MRYPLTYYYLYIFVLHITSYSWTPCEPFERKL